MSRVRARPVIIMLYLLVAASQVNISNRAYACEIPQPPGPLEVLDRSAAVFSGRVTEIQNGTRQDIEFSAVIFDVDTYWKSSENRDYGMLVIFTAIDEGACGYHFEEGKNYLVYASVNQNDGSLFTGLGTRNQPIENAHEDLAVLGSGAPPAAQLAAEEQMNRAKFQRIVDSDPQIPDVNISFPLVVGVGAAAAGTVVFLLLRKRRCISGTDSKDV